MILFASDFDNTLHFVDEKGNGYFKKEDIEAIKRFRREGNVFGLCTGRPLYGLNDDMKGAPEMDYVIASTGGLITDIQKDGYHVLWQKTIDLSVLYGIYEQSEQNGYEMYVHADGNVYTFQHRRPQYTNQIILETLDELEGKSITGISIWTPDEKHAASFVEHLNETIESIAVFQNRNWMDVVEKSVSKGHGAFEAEKLFHCGLVAGIGDSYNDIPLLHDADIAFTFHSSPEVVKKEADYIVDSVAEAIAILEKK